MSYTLPKRYFQVPNTVLIIFGTRYRITIADFNTKFYDFLITIHDDADNKISCGKVEVNPLFAPRGLLLNDLAYFTNLINDNQSHILKVLE